VTLIAYFKRPSALSALHSCTDSLHTTRASKTVDWNPTHAFSLTLFPYYSQHHGFIVTITSFERPDLNVVHALNNGSRNSGTRTNAMVLPTRPPPPLRSRPLHTYITYCISYSHTIWPPANYFTATQTPSSALSQRSL